MGTSKKTASQDTSCVNLQELEEKYEKDLLKDLLTEAEGGTTPEEEGSRQGKKTKTKKIPFLRKYIPQLETLDFKPLEEAANVKFDEQQKERPKDRILDLINTYHRDSITWAKGASAGKAKIHMNDTAEAANILSDCLSCETPEKHAIVDHYWPFKDISPLQFQIYLAQVEASAKDAADDISTGPGNPGNPHIYTLVRRLHHIWMQAGGKRRGENCWDGDAGLAKGPFLFFLQLLLEQAGEYYSLSALHSVIRSALKT